MAGVVGAVRRRWREEKSIYADTNGPSLGTNGLKRWGENREKESSLYLWHPSPELEKPLK